MYVRNWKDQISILMDILIKKKEQLALNVLSNNI